MILSALQQRGLDAVGRWYSAGYNEAWPFYYFGGYAGTGKSTIAERLTQGIDGRVEFAAFTGKAALVMRQKGCPGARTIHSMIYRVTGDSSAQATGVLVQLMAELETKTAEYRAFAATRSKTDGVDFALLSKRSELEKIEKQIAEVKGRAKRQPGFMLNPDSDAARAKLIVVDECSMVDARIGEDLLSFKVPILVLGDPAQLPPVMGGGFFTKGQPHFLLDEVHRHTADSGILRLATKIRNRESISEADSRADVEVLRKSDKPAVLAAAIRADQILVGRNKTRHGTNARVRQLTGRRGQIPIEGDRVVCLRNDYDAGVLNGSLWSVQSCLGEVSDDVLALRLASLDEARDPIEVTAHTAHFLGHVEEQTSRDAQDFAFGYALTVHKSQGSQWPSVCVIDESDSFGEPWRHIYTAVTRASERLAVAI